MACHTVRPAFRARQVFHSQLQCLNRPLPPSFILPPATVRHASGSSKSQKGKDATTKKKKARTDFHRDDVKNAMQFSLCDAMRYIRAFEVGRNPKSTKYEVAVSFKTAKNGPVVRNRLRLPSAVDTSQRVCVICPPDSAAAKAAVNAGATLVGEDVIFDAVKEGRIEFERCICHIDSLQKLDKAKLGRILGPRKLMPSAKNGTVVKDVANSVKDMIGGSEYREKLGVVRLAIGQLRFTPEELQRNIKEFMTLLKKDIAQLTDKVNKEIHEVVLSSTNGPGFSLNGDFRSPTSLPTRDLSVL